MPSLRFAVKPSLFVEDKDSVPTLRFAVSQNSSLRYKLNAQSAPFVIQPKFLSDKTLRAKSRLAIKAQIGDTRYVSAMA